MAINLDNPVGSPTGFGNRMLLLVLPALFILMWSSGYVAGKLALPYAGPFTLIFIRFAVAAAVMLCVSVAFGAPWPKLVSEYVHLAVVGFLVQAVQFSGLYFGLSHGISAGVSAVIVGMMPIFTALGAFVVLKESVNARQVLGLLIGLIGVAIVVSGKISFAGSDWVGYAAVAIALFGITSGTLYQKRYCPKLDLRSGVCVQLATATIVAGLLAYFVEDFRVQWTPALIGASAWLSIVNSIGAVSVMFLLMRRGKASVVASLFYLIPSVTAVMGYLVLGEKLTIIQIAGFIVSASGVYLTTRAK